jgi:hypothetical protein
MTDKPKSTKSTIFKLTLWWTIILTLIKLFESPLINSVFIFFYGPIILIGYLGLFTLLVFSIIYLVRQRNKAYRPFIPFSFSLLTIAFILFFPFTEFTLQVDFRLKKNDRERVIKMITNKEINYDLNKSAFVTIPTGYSNLSAGSANVLVEIIDNKTCIFFYTFRGLTDNSAGFVYVPDDKIISNFKIGQNSSSTIFYDPIEITKIADHWYFIANT